MSKRKRNLRLHIMVSHEELAAIQKRMKDKARAHLFARWPLMDMP